IHEYRINGYEFKKKVLAWINMFLTRSTGNPNSPTFSKGLYRPNDITPYIHTLVYHISEFLNIHETFGINAFSCSPVEKKNHQHVSYFFQKTFNDGGNSEKRKSALVEIMEYENRTHFFFTHNVPTFFEKDTNINI
ncbi:1572_t:CDS:1, partial [Scutellospora calospora]